MRVKTSDLTGDALDWAVAKCEGCELDAESWKQIMTNPDWTHAYGTDWSQGGPILEREKITVSYETNKNWSAISDHPVDDWIVTEGPTPLIAAMRCFVASHLGDEVNIPDELLKEESK